MPFLSNQSANLNNGTEDSGGAPNVEAALNMTPSEAQKLAAEPRKSTIGQRKPASKVRILLVLLLGLGSSRAQPLVLSAVGRQCMVVSFYIVSYNC